MRWVTLNEAIEAKWLQKDGWQHQQVAPFNRADRVQLQATQRLDGLHNALGCWGGLWSIEMLFGISRRDHAECLLFDS